MLIYEKLTNLIFLLMKKQEDVVKCQFINRTNETCNLFQISINPFNLHLNDRN
jgi:hypothetical protein